MISPSQLLRRLMYLVRRSSADTEMQDEMRQHLEMEIEEQVRLGATRDEARRNALIAFGGVERFKEDARDARGVRVLEDAVRDLGYTLRALRRHKGYTLAATGILTVGVAGTVIVTSAVNYLLYRAPPIRDPDAVVVITERWQTNGWFNSTFGTWVYPYQHYEELREASGDVLSDLAGFRHEMFSLSSGEQVRSINGGIATPNYFAMLGMQPTHGRLFIESREPMGYEVVLSHAFWETEFGSSRDVIGRVLYIDSRPHEVIGVVPKDFHSLVGVLHADVWIPTTTFSVSPWLTLVGRLRDGVKRSQAAAALAPIIEATPSAPRGGEIGRVDLDTVRGVPAMMKDYAFGFSGFLIAVVALVLFIGVANLSALMLARATNRRREVSVRLAMGASRSRVARQLLVESLTLCLLGTGFGSLLAWWFVTTVPPRIVPPVFGLSMNFPFDALTWGAGFTVALLAAVGSGVGPALSGTRVDLSSALRGREDDSPRRRSIVRSVIVGAQLAVSLVLLIMAGLLVQVLRHSLDVDPGFVADNVAIGSVQLGPHGYDVSRSWELIHNTLERIQVDPQVGAATVGRWMPLAGSTHGGTVFRAGADGEAQPVNIYFGAVHHTYFETMQVPLLAGRTFTEVEGREPVARVAVVNESLARRLSGDQNPSPVSLLPSPVSFRFQDENWNVIGIVPDGRYVSPDESPRAYMFVPFQQRDAQNATFLVRSANGAAVGLDVLRRSLAMADPNIALEFPDDFAERLRFFVLPQRIALWFIGAFGMVGMILATTGIYGAVGYHVAQRTREFGIRVALGARQRDVIWHVIHHTASTTGVAVLVGCSLAFGLASYLGRMLQNQFMYNVSASPWNFIGMSVLLAVVALVAAWLPARRAAAADPMSAIRVD